MITDLFDWRKLKPRLAEGETKMYTDLHHRIADILRN